MSSHPTPDPALAALEDRLRTAAGLDLSGCCPNTALRAVQRRCAVLGNLPVADYLARLASTGDEFWNLVEEVVVPETWFFREPEAFTAMARLGSQAVATGTSPYRVLSLPCATGEEPYSAVMTLLAAGLPATAFTVEGADISRRLLDRAAAGRYNRHSFRGGSARAWSRFFESSGEERTLSEEVRGAVRFRQANLLHAPEFGDCGPYDFILCRNLLIYFSPEAQRRAVETLCSLLKPEGCLVVAVAESRIVRRHGLGCRMLCGGYVFQTANAGSVTASLARRRLPRSFPGPVTPPPGAAQASTPPAPPTPSPASGSSPGRDAREEMALAMTLADQGRLAEAAEVCERHLQRSPPTARAYYLLGLVRDAAGQAELATELYRKALYLDPHHEEALVHLALLLERAGDLDGGRVLRERARRSRTMEGLSP